MRLIIKLDVDDIKTRSLGVNTEIVASPFLSIIFSADALNELFADRERLSVPLDFDEQLSIRTYNVLRRADIRTRYSLSQTDAKRLLHLPGFGPKSLEEVKNYLEFCHLTDSPCYTSLLGGSAKVGGTSHSNEQTQIT